MKKRGASILGEYTVGAEVFDAERILWRREYGWFPVGVRGC